MSTNAKILEQLQALGACYSARQWFFEEGFKTAQEAWDSPGIKPKDMLWILRRTMGKSYRKRRALAKLAVELLDLTHEEFWYTGHSLDEALRQALISYGEGKLQLRALRKLNFQAVDHHRGWTSGSSLCSSLANRSGEDGALYYQGLIYPASPEVFVEQQALIRKHFPKPPRLS